MRVPITVAIAIFAGSCASPSTSGVLDASTGYDAAAIDASSGSTVVSDITPKSGKGTPPSGSSDGGPWSTRMMLATSTDGKTFKRTNEVVSDQAGVPNAFVDREGRLRLAYIDWGNGNIIATAVRNTDGHWAYRRILFSPALTTDKPDPVDPSIVKLADGSYRLFFMLKGKFLSAHSQDGFVFTPDEGERFPYEKPLYDPAVVETKTGWLLWANIGSSTFAWGKSSDGLNFIASPDLFRLDGKSMTVWSAAQVSGGYRISGGLEGTPGIASAFSVDGVSWTIEGAVLTDKGADPAIEKALYPDHGYTQLPDATYAIAYLAQIP